MKKRKCPLCRYYVAKVAVLLPGGRQALICPRCVALSERVAK